MYIDICLTESGSLKSSTDDSSDNTAAADTKSKVSGSIVLERKRLAKLREAHRKAVLNSENNYEYVQMSDGSFKRGKMQYHRYHRYHIMVMDLWMIHNLVA